jgi:hypothetical protein
MTQRSNSVQSSPVISDARLREPIRRELDRAINIERRLTRGELAEASGVNIHTIDQLLSRSPEKQRRVALEDAASLAWVLGERAINAVLASFGFGGARPLDAEDSQQPMMIVANAMRHLSVIGKAAADGRIDHVEEPDTTEAADMIIAELAPLSSAGKRA